VRTPSVPVLVCLCAFALPGYATSATVTVAQLEQFLTSTRAAKLTDAEIAGRLSKVDLSEELTEKSLTRILGESSPGPETLEQLKILAAVSVLQKPPASELPVESAPDPAARERLVSAARDYVRNALHLVPNLLAIRETRGFNNLPVDAEEKHRKPKVKMHFASEARSGIVVRGGKELDAPAEGHEDRGQFGLSSGLSSWGEFGAVPCSCTQ